MIDYDEGKWSLAFAFQLRGSVIPKAMVWVIPCCLLSVAFHLMLGFVEYAVDSSSEMNANLSALSFVLGFLIVFRTQKAYDRWWEAGSALETLRGEWFNAFSCLIAFGNRDPAFGDELEALNQKLVRLFSLLYGTALRQCSTMEDNSLEFIDFSGLDEPHLKHLIDAHDPCEIVLQWIQRTIVEATDKGIIKIAPPILARVYNQLGSGIVKLSGASRIKKFPIPFLLAQLVVVLMVMHWAATAVVAALTLSNPGKVFIAVFISQLCYWGVHYIAVELEGPYGGDANDLNLREMQRDMNTSLKHLVQPLSISAPSFKHIHGDDGSHQSDPMAVVDVDLSEHLAKTFGQVRDTPAGDDFSSYLHSLARSFSKLPGTLKLDRPRKGSLSSDGSTNGFHREAHAVISDESNGSSVRDAGSPNYSHGDAHGIAEGKKDDMRHHLKELNPALHFDVEGGSLEAIRGLGPPTGPSQPCVKGAGADAEPRGSSACSSTLHAMARPGAGGAALDLCASQHAGPLQRGQGKAASSPLPRQHGAEGANDSFCDGATSRRAAACPTTPARLATYLM